MAVTTDNLMEQGKVIFVWGFSLAARCKHTYCCVLLWVWKHAISLLEEQLLLLWPSHSVPES